VTCATALPQPLDQVDERRRAAMSPLARRHRMRGKIPASQYAGSNV